MGAVKMDVQGTRNSGVIAVSVEDAVRIANIGRTKLYELIGDGSLPARKCGRRTVILISDLEALLHGLPQIDRRAA
jgi:excisionase family DNA binding protein